MANELPKRLQVNPDYASQIALPGSYEPISAVFSYSRIGDGAHLCAELVRRYNAHEALVEAVEMFLSAIDLANEKDDNVVIHKDHVARARSALEAARRSE